MSKIHQNTNNLGIIASILISWYNPNSRNLPWKKTKNPYFIWLSEIILQQTRVAQGTPYYLKFETEFPTIESLASAPINKVLKLWEGLGYYSRARNLHAAANFVVNDLNGVFPKNYKDLLQLKGVGEYTAAAIASFAYNEPVAVIDGNVFRFLSRFFGIKTPIDSQEGKKLFKKIANEELDKNKPAVYNQAIMDFGATMCLPKLPKCDICPFQNDCIAFKEQLIDQLPIKSKKVKVKHRFFNYYIFMDKTHLLIQQRNKQDIWKGLFEFPMEEIKHSKTPQQKKVDLAQFKYINEPALEYGHSPVYKQTLTHQKIEAQFNIVKFSSLQNMEFDSNQTLISKKSLNQYPFPKIINDFLNDFKL